MTMFLRRATGIIASNSFSLALNAPRYSWTARRTITNATKPEHVQSLLSVKRGPEKEGGWHPTLIHSSSDLKWTVIRLQPGHGEVPSHLHTKVWDYFIPLSGKAVIETKTKDGIEKSHEMQPDTFLAVPAGDVHRVRNASEDKEFVFLIAQTPRSMYDFVGSGNPVAQASTSGEVVN